MRVVGIIPARMASSRFPGKPLHPILGMSMIEHVYRRAAMFDRWDGLFLATCDAPIETHGREKGWKVISTSDTHTRALDRVAEAALRCGMDLQEQDIVVCVQGDEPMLRPDMVEAAIVPLLDDPETVCTVLAMHIVDEDLYRNPDTVKIVHDLVGNVLYTSRAPIPYTLPGEFGEALEARRIYGIFGFRAGFLQEYTKLPESPLELKETCDSNRIVDHGFRQRIAPYPVVPSFSVDSPADVHRVEETMKNDPLWKEYRPR